MKYDDVVYSAAFEIIKVRWKDSGRIPNPLTRGNSAARNTLASLKASGVFSQDYGNHRSTGKMENAIRVTCPEPGHIVIDFDESVNYVPYTTEPWISPRWNGKKNPNEGWFKAFYTEFTYALARKLGGKITQSHLDGKAKRTQLQNVMRRKTVKEALSDQAE